MKHIKGDDNGPIEIGGVQESSPLRYWVTFGTEVRGPFDLNFIHAMALAEIFPTDISCCLEGSQQWIALDVLKMGKE